MGRWFFFLVCIAATAVWFVDPLRQGAVNIFNWSWPALKWVLIIGGSMLGAAVVVAAFSDFYDPVTKHLNKQWRRWWNSI